MYNARKKKREKKISNHRGGKKLLILNCDFYAIFLYNRDIVA